jgi:hypothetical protein
MVNHFNMYTVIYYQQNNQTHITIRRMGKQTHRRQWGYLMEGHLEYEAADKQDCKESSFNDLNSGELIKNGIRQITCISG